MTPTLTLHPIGIALGALYAAIFGGILWWMLHPLPCVPRETADGHRSRGTVKLTGAPELGAPDLERRLGLGKATSSRNGTGRI